MAYDTYRHRTMLYGGGPDYGTNYRDLWDYVAPDAPFINGITPDQTVPAGARVTLHVGAAGTQPFTYQWRVEGVPLSDHDNISGSNTSTLVIDPINLTDGDVYDACFVSAVSNPVTITVVCTTDLNHDGSLDDFDYFDFLNSFFSNEDPADFNGDTNVDDFDYFDFLNGFFAGC
ncbi:MAG: immunoglobulin domain-containing protein [Phycisphaerae bacterium]|nr:immunoglobulin domain-containing protein [Phycisphaerae bacterium]